MRRTFFILLFVPGFFACEPAPGVDGGVDGGIDAGEVVSGRRTGAVQLSSSCGQECSTRFNASFTVDPNDAGAAPCVRSTIGRCSLLECPGADAGVTYPVLVPTISASAGVVSIEGTQFDGGVHLATGDGVDLFVAAQRAWHGGETVSVSSSGGDVPAFSGTVVAPEAIEFTSPRCAGPFGGCGTLPRNTPLTITWTGGTTTSVRVSLLSVDPDAPRARLSAVCTFDASPATVDLEVMQRLVPTSAGATNSLSLSARNARTVTAGEWTVELTASGVGSNGSFSTGD